MSFFWTLCPVLLFPVSQWSKPKQNKNNFLPIFPADQWVTRSCAYWPNYNQVINEVDVWVTLNNKFKIVYIWFQKYILEWHPAIELADTLMFITIYNNSIWIYFKDTSEYLLGRSDSKTSWFPPKSFDQAFPRIFPHWRLSLLFLELS